MTNSTPNFSQEEHERRWRLVLGKQPDESTNPDGKDEDEGGGNDLAPQDQNLDDALEMLYGDSKGGDLSDSAPDIARWLGDIRNYFPAPTVRIMQQDALKRFKLRRLLAEPTLLAEIEPDINLVTNILALKRIMPGKTRETAKQVVRQVVEELQRQLAYPLEQAITGSLNRALRTRRPRHKEINWSQTVHANLKHYQPDYNTIVPETLVGYGRQRSSLRDIIVCQDTSGSMATSVVYGSIYAAVMASITAVSTRLVMFDTAVVDLTEELEDPVELLFGIRLGGGTNIDRALTYCRQHIIRPKDTIFILISDLFEGGNKDGMRQQIANMVADGVQVVVLLALNDQGAPRFDRQMAQDLVTLGVPSFACTPDVFPDLMAAVINGRDIGQWAASNDIVTAPDN